MNQNNTVQQYAGPLRLPTYRFLLIIGLLFTFTALAAPDFPVELRSKELKEFGVIRAWNGSRPKEDYFAKRGDSIYVEVKNPSGWLIRQIDREGRMDHDVFKKISTDLGRILDERLFELGHLAYLTVHDVAKADVGSYTSRIDSKDSNGLKEWEILADKLAGIEALPREPRPTTAEIEVRDKKRSDTLKDKRAPEAVVDTVLSLPTFQRLGSIFKDKRPEQKLAILAELNSLQLRFYQWARNNFVLTIDDHRFTNSKPINAETAASIALGIVKPNADDDYSWFRFNLVHDAASAPFWENLRKQLEVSKQVRLTLTLAVGNSTYAMRTMIVPEGERLTSWPGFGVQNISPDMVSVGWLVVGAMFLMMIILGTMTDLVRDSAKGYRPDGLRPHSLSRWQMAFWFFLVVAAFVFLWAANGELQPLNETCLWLIGIGSGTALGSALIEDPSTVRTDFRVGWKACPRWKLRSRFIEELKKSADVLKALIDGGTFTTAQEVEHTLLREQLAAIKATNTNFVGRLFEDWLAENGKYSFHRYQMLVWTVVLGVVFIYHVRAEFKMPEFDKTLLALVGISNGTYLGFRLQKAKE